jgi:hypothetical protein
VALGAALAGLPTAPGRGGHQSELQCSTSGYFYRVTVFYSIAEYPNRTRLTCNGSFWA